MRLHDQNSKQSRLEHPRSLALWFTTKVYRFVKWRSVKTGQYFGLFFMHIAIFCDCPFVICHLHGAWTYDHLPCCLSVRKCISGMMSELLSLVGRKSEWMGLVNKACDLSMGGCYSVIVVLFEPTAVVEEGFRYSITSKGPAFRTLKCK